jgi:hypothetical protein
MDTEALRGFVHRMLVAVEQDSGFTQANLTICRDGGGYSVRQGDNWRWFPARDREQAFRAFLDSLAVTSHD